MEWSEVEPDDVDRMLIERKIAFGRGPGGICFRGCRRTRPGTSTKVSPTPSFFRSRTEAGRVEICVRQGPERERGKRFRRYVWRGRTAKEPTSSASPKPVSNGYRDDGAMQIS